MNHYSAKSYSLKPAEVSKKWIVINASNLVLGRLASRVAMILRGKNKPLYTPHVDCGDNVVIVNAEKVAITGNKMDDLFYWHTGHPGGIKSRSMKKRLEGDHAFRVIKKAVQRMLPKESPLARKQLKNLYVYNGPEHPHAGQEPKEVKMETLNSKNYRSKA